MATYAVGDIQGCYEPLAQLLDTVNFDQSKDTLLCVGDLVNRGPDSLKTLRLLISLKNQCVSVLGNHDIHLLSMIYGVREHRCTDTLLPILEAHDRDWIADWLRQKPLLVIDKKRKIALCHAGIYPWWSRQQALDLAHEVERVFTNEQKCVRLLNKIYSNLPSKWSDDLGKTQRRRFVINAFTRMRFCSPKGHLNLTESGFANKTRKNRVPWFSIPNNSFDKYRIVFGHWSALGLLNTPQHLCLDTGCVWGRELTMAKISKNPNKPVKLISSGK